MISNNIKITFVICAGLCFSFFADAQAAISVPASASIVKTKGTQLIVARRKPNGILDRPSAYIIRGVTWDPATAAPAQGPNPIGPGDVPYGFFFDWPGRNPQGFEVFNYWKKSEFASHYQKDLDLMAQMHVNTVRVYSDLGNASNDTLTVLDECYRRGIMVVMTVANSKTELESQSYLNLVLQYKNHPAILMWALGNEWNLNNYFGFQNMPQAIAATNAAAASIKNIDPNHPVSSSLGDRFSSDPVVCASNDPCCGSPLPLSDIPAIVNGAPYVDIWGLNIYRGKSFTNLFDQWKTTTNKPFYIGEFGIDAYDTQSYSLVGCGLVSNATGQINEEKQSEVDTGLWQELTVYLSALNPQQPVLGGFIHQFNDALWKVGSYQTGLGGIVKYDGPDNIPGTADDDTSYKEYNNEGFVTGGAPDHVSNEEYYGVVTAGRSPKTVYTDLKDLFTNMPNLILNPGFENQLHQWKTQGVIDSDIHQTGANSLKLTGNNIAESDPPIRVIPNQRYLVSAWVKGSKAQHLPLINKDVRINIQWFDDAGHLIMTQKVNPYVINLKFWQFYSHIWTAPANAATAIIQCQTQGTNTAWFDNISVIPFSKLFSNRF